MPRATRRPRRQNLDYSTGWYYPAAPEEQQYGVKRTWGQLLYDISPLGFIIPRRTNKTPFEDTADGYVPNRPEILRMFPDPLKPSRSTARLPKGLRAKSLKLPRL